jgi:hypothetical protein
LRNLSKTVSGWASLDSDNGVTTIEYGLYHRGRDFGTNLSGLFDYTAGKVVAP